MITISKTGTAKAKGWDGVSGLTVSDTLPAQVTFTNFSTTNGTAVTPSDYAVSNGSLQFAAGETKGLIKSVRTGAP